jgi:PIN domain nuclease of toxin-antitoxin system
VLGVRWEHIERIASLPRRGHGDPFDRMIAAQALVEHMSLVSNDAKLDAFGIVRIW